MNLMAHLPALQVVLPMLAAVICALVRRGWLAWFIALVISWAMPIISALLLYQVLTVGPISYAMGGWAPPIGIEYRVDALAGLILLLVSIGAAVMMPFANLSVDSEVPEKKQAWFYTMYLLCLSGLLGIAITGDAFNAFVFLEISSLSTYAMVAMGKDKRALVAAFQYLIIGTVGATCYVIAVGLLYSMTGTLNFVQMAEIIKEIGNAPPIFAALAFITVGVALKFALFPLHGWLPNAYAYAPSFATAFLAATATKVSVYLVLRFFYSIYTVDAVFTSHPVTELLLALSILAMFIASIVAVFQENVKRMLAYSSVAQMGYITLGISLANENGLTGGIVHIFNHAIIKGALFMAVGCMVYRIGVCKFSNIAGIGRQMPWTMASFTLAGLAIIGVPGTAGFVSKWYLGLATLDKGFWWALVLLVMSSFIAVIYVGKMIEIAYFREPEGDVLKVKEAPLPMLVPTLILAAATIYFGLDTSWTVDIAKIAAKDLLGGS